MITFSRYFSFFALLFTFWPTLRLGGFAVFDVFAPCAAVLLLMNGSKDRRPENKKSPALLFAWLGLFFLFLASILSAIMSTNTAEHFTRTGKLILAFTDMILFSFALVTRSGISFRQILAILCLSATISSAVCIAQGQFGLFRLLTFQSELDINEMSRFTGLAEHPIEAGYISVFGVLFGVVLFSQKNKRLFFALLTLTNLYSMRYSGSLTSFFALVAGVIALLFYSKSFKTVLSFTLLMPLLLSWALLGDPSSPLTKRITQLTEVGNKYSTIQSREGQWKETFALMDMTSLIYGRGYSLKDMPQGDIHNGILSSTYSFGILGFLSQLAFFAFFLFRLKKQPETLYKSVLLSAFLVFLAAYMTGPALSRRSLWMPLFLLSTYLARNRSIQNSTSVLLVGRKNENA